MENDVYRAKPAKKSRLKFFIPIFLALGLYVFRQAYLINANSVDTVKAVEGYINDSIISQGIICREEIVLSNSLNGVVDYVTQDGERVSKGQVLAGVYPTYSDISNIKSLRNKENMLADIESVENFLYYGTVDMSVTKKQLSEQLSRLASLTVLDDYRNIEQKLTDLTLSLNKVGVATGRITDFSDAKQQLENEISSVKADISRASGNLYSMYTGYFLNSVDGYEKTASVENFLNMTVEEGQNIINNSASVNIPDNSYGKIITDYKWSICMYVDTETASNLSVKQNIRLSIDVKNNRFSKATITHMVDLGEKTLVVAQCSNISQQSVKNRIVDCEILFRQYSGLKIPKTAIHFVDEQMGVYVNFSNLVQFKKITPVFEDENYIIVPAEYSAENQVKLHDAIIVKGRNLYDGKYL